MARAAAQPNCRPESTPRERASRNARGRPVGQVACRAAKRPKMRESLENLERICVDLCLDLRHALQSLHFALNSTTSLRFFLFLNHFRVTLWLACTGSKMRDSSYPLEENAFFAGHVDCTMPASDVQGPDRSAAC